MGKPVEDLPEAPWRTQSLFLLVAKLVREPVHLTLLNPVPAVGTEPCVVWTPLQWTFHSITSVYTRGHREQVPRNLTHSMSGLSGQTQPRLYSRQWVNQQKKVPNHMQIKKTEPEVND